LKIARSLINRSATEPESAATLRAIVNFAHDVGIAVTAQGIETEQQRDLLTLNIIPTRAPGDPTATLEGYATGSSTRIATQANAAISAAPTPILNAVVHR
jgi:predicted signal transduction protein with EAL and GGDEF domain